MRRFWIRIRVAAAFAGLWVWQLLTELEEG